MKRIRRRTREVVLLKDLAPRQEIKGGSGKRLFGERIASTESEAKARRVSRKTKPS
ncbi:MAG: hypothetical protein ABI592_06055 [Acidobacteriota bacterium]